MFLSLCLCFDCPLVILCLSASVSERVRIQGDGIVGWAQMSPRKVQQSRAGYNTGQIRTAECSRTQESRAEQSRAQMSAKKVTCSLFGITLSRTKVSRAQGSQKCLFNVKAVYCCWKQCRAGYINKG